LKAYVSVSEARASIGQYLQFCNTIRLHQSRGRRTPDVVYFESAESRIAALDLTNWSTTMRDHEILDESVESGHIVPLDTEATAQAMLAFLEGVILLAKTRNDPEVVRVLGPAIKSLRIELAAENRIFLSRLLTDRSTCST